MLVYPKEYNKYTNKDFFDLIIEIGSNEIVETNYTFQKIGKNIQIDRYIIDDSYILNLTNIKINISNTILKSLLNNNENYYICRYIDFNIKNKPIFFNETNLLGKLIFLLEKDILENNYKLFSIKRNYKIDTSFYMDKIGKIFKKYNFEFIIEKNDLFFIKKDHY